MDKFFLRRRIPAYRLPALPTGRQAGGKQGRQVSKFKIFNF
jgi:hypothetical protein